jgi:pimeloyl-ACP methyl ester carboxylesterase
MNIMSTTPPLARLPGTPAPMTYLHSAGGLRIAADVWGPADGPVVLLQHGGGQTRHAWRRTGVALAAAGYRAVAFDTRGHGDSDWDAAGQYEQDSMVADLQSVVSALGAKAPVLVGASMGGSISLRAAGEELVAASALVLVDIAPRIERVGVARINAFMKARPQGFDSLDEVSQAIQAYRGQHRTGNDMTGLSKNVRIDANGKYQWHWDPRFFSRTSDGNRHTARLEQCARALTIPTLLVKGGRSDILSDAGVQAFRSLCPHAEFVEIAATGHMVAGDRNDAFSDAVVQFLKRVKPSQQASKVSL